MHNETYFVLQNEKGKYLRFIDMAVDGYINGLTFTDNFRECFEFPDAPSAKGFITFIEHKSNITLTLMQIDIFIN